LDQKRVIEPKEILERLVHALSSGLWGIVIDRNLADLRGVEEFFSDTKLWGTFLIESSKNLTIIRINERGIRNRCLYEQCSKVPEEELEVCIGKCTLNSIDEIRTRLVEILKEMR